MTVSLTLAVIFIILAMVCFLLETFMPPPAPPHRKINWWTLGWAFVMAAWLAGARW